MDDQDYGEFVRLYTKSERDLRQFIRSLVPSWNDAEEVLQQAAIVLWKKFDQFDSTSQDPRDFLKWGCVVARFEALAYRKKKARDRHVFNDDLFEIMADEAAEESDQRSEEFCLLEQCLSTLSQSQRELVKLAYTPGVKVKELAEKAGSTPEAFYMKLNRLRKRLMDCVQTKVKKAQQT